MPSEEQIRTPSTRAHPYRASSSFPCRPRQVEGVGAVGTGRSLDRGAAEGLPHPGYRSVGIQSRTEERPPAEGTPAVWLPRGPQLRQRCPSWAEERPGPYACPGSLDWRWGVALRGGERREEEEDGEAADAERRRPGCQGGRLCVVTLCATC